MKTFTLKWDEIQQSMVGETPEFPRYTTQIMNLANQNAQGTRPRVVGQMSELIEEFPGDGYDEWTEWYKRQKPEALESATERVYAMVERLRDAMRLIDRPMVEQWIHDLVLAKTFVGFRYQNAILTEIAKRLGEEMARATPSEESQGIDGYIGGTAVSVKPTSYGTMRNLLESIEIPIVFYEKKKQGIWIDATSLSEA